MDKRRDMKIDWWKEDGQDKKITEEEAPEMENRRWGVQAPEQGTEKELQKWLGKMARGENKGGTGGRIEEQYEDTVRDRVRANQL